MNRKLSFDEILAVCLEELETHPGALDATLARYPQVADELRPLLEAAQWLSTRAPILDPRPGFVAASRQRLVREVRRAPARAAFWDRLLGTRHRPIVVPIALSLMILTFFLAVLGGRSLSTSAAHALPGETLYPAKAALEDLQLVASLSDEGDARLYMQFADRRVNEIEQMLLDGETAYIDRAIARYERQTQAAIQLVEAVATVDTERGVALSRWVAAGLDQQSTSLALMMEISPGGVNPALEQIVAANDRNRKTVHEIVVTLETLEPTRAKPPTQSVASPNPAVGSTATAVTPSEEATRTVKPTQEPKATKTDKLTSTPKPTQALKATKTDKPTNTSKPTKEEKPTDEPKPTKEEKPTDAPEPTEEDKDKDKDKD
ncbi:MAG: DUF5667 domain-containing protein [Chloroflexota bacterium]